MAKPYPKNPRLIGGFAPIQMECDAADLIIEGEVPNDLLGTFFRNGPNPQFTPRGEYHWFSGDGMIHAFHIEGGKVSYKNRYVQTVKYKAEKEAGKNLINALNPMDMDPSVADVKFNGVANTNVLWHSDKLLALEEGNAPFELDPVTLESKGSWTFNDTLTGPMTAHPKIDPETGEMIFFGYSIDGMLSNKMSYHVVSREGELIDSQFFDAPYAAMVHDFIVTRDFVIFPIQPLTASLDRAMKGIAPFAWEPNKQNHLGVMRRGGKVEDLRWFKNDASYVFHPMNAFNEGNVIICDVCEYPRPPGFPGIDGSKPGPDNKAKLNRWTIDFDSPADDYQVEQLTDVSCEFPRFDERYAGLAYRYGYMVCDSEEPSEVGGYGTICKYDHLTGERDSYELGPHQGTSEAIFVPKNETAAEGEGYLLSNVYDGRTDKSYLLILDAQQPSKGPLAKAYLDHRVPYGFHGNWKQG